MTRKRPGHGRAYWRGGTWSIRPAATDTDRERLGDDNQGVLISDKRLILYRADMDDDGALLTIIHEMIHEVAPKLTENEVRAAERDIKHFLEVFGVDLSPLMGDR